MPKVAYLGSRGTNGFVAAQEYFGADLVEVPQPFNMDVVVAVADRTAQYGVVPIENVIDGVIAEVVRAMDEEAGLGVRICGEVTIPIEHKLIGKATNIADVRTICTHPSAKRQCSVYLRKLMASQKIELIDTASTTDAAEICRKGNSSIAAIASIGAQKEYNLEILKEDISDIENNQTRFWIIGRDYSPMTKPDVNPNAKHKTCILLNLSQDQPGGLVKALKCFAEKQVNVAIIFPCPIPKHCWEYTFLLEVDGHIENKDEKKPDVRGAYDALRKLRLGLAAPLILGAYDTQAVWATAKRSPQIMREDCPEGLDPADARRLLDQQTKGRHVVAGHSSGSRKRQKEKQT